LIDGTKQLMIKIIHHHYHHQHNQKSSMINCHQSPTLIPEKKNPTIFFPTPQDPIKKNKKIFIFFIPDTFLYNAM
jgi:hypothetical protein